MIEIYVASAFSKDNQGGNKAGVVFERPDLSVKQKMAIASYLGYSETAFVTESKAADFEIQYFTPTEEVPLCGHATIAAFSAMYHLGIIKPASYTIETKAGILRIQVDGDGLVFMEQNPPIYYDYLEMKDLKDSIDLEQIDSAKPIQIVSTGLKDIILPIKSEECLANIHPGFDGISVLSKEKNAVGIHAFAFTQDSAADAVCRNFAPLYGINEESATGTASCALASYLFKYYQKKNQYIFEQGYSLNAPSKIVVNVEYHEDIIDAIFVGGYGYMTDEIQLDEEI